MNRNPVVGFLADVSKGTLLTTIGPALASEFGISSAFAEESPALSFGDMESLVCFMQETPISKLQPALAAELQVGRSAEETRGRRCVGERAHVWR